MLDGMVYAKERAGRWVIFERVGNDLCRRYSTNRCPRDIPRIAYPSNYVGNGSLTDSIRIVSATGNPNAHV